jgi:AAT family amino acid transporter
MGVDIEKRPRRYESGDDVDAHQRDGSEDYTPPLVVADKLSRSLSARQVQLIAIGEMAFTLFCCCRITD